MESFSFPLFKDRLKGQLLGQLDREPFQSFPPSQVSSQVSSRFSSTARVMARISIRESARPPGSWPGSAPLTPDSAPFPSHSYPIPYIRANPVTISLSLQFIAQTQEQWQNQQQIPLNSNTLAIPQNSLEPAKKLKKIQ